MKIGDFSSSMKIGLNREMNFTCREKKIAKADSIRIAKSRFLIFLFLLIDQRLTQSQGGRCASVLNFNEELSCNV